MKKYRQAIVSFTGFRQNDSSRSGFEDGYFKYIARMQDENTLCYEPRTWKTNVKYLADQLRRQGVERIAMLSYSHGQAAAVDFAKYCYEIGIEVDLWLACDPVARTTWLPRWTIAQFFAWQALFKKGKIKVPRNISRTVYIRQEFDMPRGHTLVPEGSNIVELAGILHSIGHTEIDESHEFWNIVREELPTWINPPKAILIPE